MESIGHPDLEFPGSEMVGEFGGRSGEVVDHTVSRGGKVSEGDVGLCSGEVDEYGDFVALSILAGEYKEVRGCGVVDVHRIHLAGGIESRVSMLEGVEHFIEGCKLIGCVIRLYGVSLEEFEGVVETYFLTCIEHRHPRESVTEDDEGSEAIAIAFKFGAFP